MESIGEYEYSKKDLIGHGAFAVVFKGRNKKKHDFVVAIKCITKKNLAKSQSLLSKEIKILKELSSLHHENVVALLDCKETTNHVYLVMEYCNGGDLADYLQAKGTLSEDTIALFLKQIAGAMKALNAKGIVHRDMKPQNILLTHSSNRPNPPAHEMQLKIADFGFARFLQDGVMAATLCGSPMYMAPEVIMSLQYDAKADLWSIGTIVYQCLTGKAPFQAQTPQQLKQFYEKNADLKPNIPTGTSSELKDLLNGMLRRNAKDRIDFEHFFNHPYVNPKPKPAASSPVPVPRSRSRSSMGESPNVKTVSASPLSGNMGPPSPHCPPVPTVLRRKDSAMELMDTAESPAQSEPAGFVRVSPGTSKIPKKPKQLQQQGAAAARVTLAEQEDFVLVPEDMPADAPQAVDLNGIFSDKNSENIPPSSSKHPPQRNVRPSPYSQAQRKSPSSPQTSPSRPSTLPVHCSPPKDSSQPIPVPSQVKAYEQIQRSIQGLSPSTSPGGTSLRSHPSPASCSPGSTVPSSAMPSISPGSSTAGVNIPPRRVGSNSSLASVGSMSPPSVQFSIGTPPCNTWKMPAGNAGQTVVGSPHRKAAGLSKITTAPSALTQLPPIVGSPTKTTTGFFSPPATDDGESPTAYKPLSTPFASSSPHHQYHHRPRTRANTCPGLLEDQMDDNNRFMVPALMERSETDMQMERSRSTGQLLKAAFASPPSSLTAGLPMCLGQTPPSGHMIVPYSGSNSSLSHAGSNSSLTRIRRYSSDYADSSTGTGGGGGSSGGGGVTFVAQSPSNMEGPISFVAPELAEETLMDKEHNETVAKLNFILALVECIIELAQSRSSPLTQSMTEKKQQQQQHGGFTLEHVSFMSEQQRRLEQLVLYVRALQLLTSSIQLAKEEVRAKRLQPSNTVKTILKDMNNYYHQCLVVCKNLHSKGATSPDNDTSLATITADKLIYTHAIEICQAAALDELFGNPQECFRRYRNAQILLHSLAQQSHNDTDRELLVKYREAVEKRLYNLHSHGYVHAVETSMSTGS